MSVHMYLRKSLRCCKILTSSTNRYLGRDEVMPGFQQLGRLYTAAVLGRSGHEQTPPNSQNEDPLTTSPQGVEPSPPLNTQASVPTSSKEQPPPSPPPAGLCCMSGCQNCVWLQYVDDILQYYKENKAKGKENTVKVKDILQEIPDESVRTFVKLELGIK
ncbi:oxidoreductase-like domain-containing protein 1 [Nematostella vectensis]|uniref:oxidoreductase-like domain-containing protein 1 n=1 Tax=Nematostella vectensis TaxID=45351 RepID=UPI002076DD5A|nr:oxidoreductase-like domain-containing protein 1 [Nematostella vectensis]